VLMLVSAIQTSASAISYSLAVRLLQSLWQAITGPGFGPQTTAGTYTVVATNNLHHAPKHYDRSATIMLIRLPTAYTVTAVQLLP